MDSVPVRIAQPTLKQCYLSFVRFFHPWETLIFQMQEKSVIVLYILISIYLKFCIDP